MVCAQTLGNASVITKTSAHTSAEGANTLALHCYLTMCDTTASELRVQRLTNSVGARGGAFKSTTQACSRHRAQAYRCTSLLKYKAICTTPTTTLIHYTKVYCESA
eukprot:11999-Heterococcus_DN1.PRE.1